MTTLSTSKKVLVIKGYDYNRGFSQIEDHVNDLKSKGYEVLFIDANKQPTSLKEIGHQIHKENFSDLDEVYIFMHGSNPIIISDTSLLFNQFSIFPYDEEHVITTSKLLNTIVESTHHRPLKVLLKSCHGQLAFNQAHRILPEGSELVTLSEDQFVNGIHYVFNSHGGQYIQPYEGSNFREIIQGTRKYNDKLYPSPTYQKIGVCTPRTTINFSKTELDILLNTIPREKLIEEVLVQLNYQGQKCLTPGYIPVLDILHLISDHFDHIKGKTYKQGKPYDNIFLQQVYDSFDLYSNLKQEYKENLDSGLKKLLSEHNDPYIDFTFPMHINRIFNEVVNHKFDPKKHLIKPLKPLQAICKEQVEDFIDYIQSSNNEYPLLDLRSIGDKHSTFKTFLYMAIAESVYAMYDQCGDKKIIPDAIFTPQQGWISPDTFEQIPETIIYIADEAMDLIENTISFIKALDFVGTSCSLDNQDTTS